jgi:hypothetical protein
LASSRRLAFVAAARLVTEGDTGRAVLSGVAGGVFLALFVLYAVAIG